MANISRYRVKTTKELNSLTKDFRKIGYNIITFGNDIRELEKGSHTVVIIKEKRKEKEGR